MKHITLIFALIFLFFGNNFAQTIEGKWKAYENGKPSSIILIYQDKDGTYSGKMVEILNKNLVNKICNNCKDERKNQPFKGLVILKYLKPNEDKTSAENGKILDPANGKEYNCKIRVDGNELRMKAYWGFLYGSRTWYKTE